MGGIDKLDMMCALYKATIRSRRWYIYIWIHTLVIAVVNACFLYRRNEKLLNPEKKTMPLRTFQSFVADGLITANVRVREKPSLESLSLPILQRVKRVQSIPTHDVRIDCIDHFPTWELKRQKLL